jgi:hypothetical protein
MKRASLPYVMLLSTGGCLWAGGDTAIVLDAKKQLFLDDYIIESATNVARVIHPARKYSGNPVLWDATVYGTVLHDEGRYRMWYQSSLGVHYAESQDGITWTKPLLDIVTVGGQKTNAVILSPSKAKEGVVSREQFPYFAELFGVEKDPRDKDAARRYKMGFLDVDRVYHGPHEDPFHKGSRRGFAVATSPDGIHWKVFDNWATDAICDGGSHFMFDERSNRYVLYGRTKLIAPEVARAWGLNGLPALPMSPEWHEFVKKTVWGRAVARVESPDFLHWNITEPVKAPVVMTADVEEQPPGSEIYALMVFPYESVYIGLIKVWHRTPEGGPLDIDLAVSHDGVRFTRVGDRSPFIPVGEVGEWDRFNNSVSNNSPIAVGDELRFYYSGRTVRHAPYDGKDTSPLGNGVGFATIPRDRFVSLAASFDGGRIITKPVRLALDRGDQELGPS